MTTGRVNVRIWRPVIGLLLLIWVFLFLSGCATNALSIAVKNNDINQTQTLLAKGVDVNAGEIPPLLEASLTGHIEIVRMLLEKGAQVDREDRQGVTPLYGAAGKGHVEVARLLIQRGADINHSTKKGDTPLLFAAFANHIEIVRMLLEKGACVDCENLQGATPLIWAAGKGYIELSQLLIQRGADINHSMKKGDTPLLFTAFANHIEIVRMLLEKGARVDCENLQGVTPLMWAAGKGYIELSQLLIQHGADINHRTKKGDTPLIFAAFANHIEIVNLLVAAGARIDDPDDLGRSALIIVAGSPNGSLEVAQLLMEKGADINRVSRNGETAFKLACHIGNADIATYLYEKGAATSFEDSSDEGVELNGKIHHILGDYFLAQDHLDKARVSFDKARDYYLKTADKYNGDVTKLVWKQVGLVALEVLAVAGTAALATAAHSSASGGRHSHHVAPPPGVKYAPQGHRFVHGYNVYRMKYGHVFLPTYQAVNVVFPPPPPGNVSLQERKAYAKAKAKHYEERSALIGQILECFDKKLSEADLHACVEGTAVQEKGSN